MLPRPALPTPRRHLLNRARLRSVADVEGDDAWKLLLLREGLEPEGEPARSYKAAAHSLQLLLLTRAPLARAPAAAFGDVLLAPAAAAAPAPAAAADARPRTLQDFIAAEGLEVTEGLVQLDYGHATAAEALRVLLPPGSEIPSAFEAVGHVAHVNLRPEVLPYRRLIAAVLLDKNPRVKTVVNKLGNIDSEWRVFEMEVIGGRDDTVAEVRQHGERFRLDFRRVYWNSRLEAEHRRLVEEHVRAGEVVLDVMAGVGPFAVPAARRGARVLANDLNPDSHKWLVENVRINGVGAAVSTYCVDGRQLMRQAAAGELRVEAPPPPPAAAQNKKSKRPGAAGAEDAVGPSPAAEQQQQQQGGKGKKAAEKPALAQAVAGPAPAFDHAIMNLPATAVEFLDAFRGAFAPALWAGRRLPWVHVYAFLRADQTTADLRARIEAALGGPLEEEPRFHSVRDVAPNKQMYCASFRVPAAVAFAAGQEGGAGGGPKRQRVD
jgi:tRNA (guanine37-N1)-methyltransferase